MDDGLGKMGLGWLPDYPDFRDYTPEKDGVTMSHKQLGQNDSVKTMLSKTGVVGAKSDELPPSVDLTEWCSPIECQGTLNSCTAHACAAVVEYFERRAFGKYTEASRLFLYKTTRNMLRWTGDTGAFLRTTMGALALFGVPPEEYWPYSIEHFDAEPSAFCYAFAQNYQAISYYRLDPPGTARSTLLDRIKTNLAAGLPAMFGVTLFNSYVQSAENGMLPFPSDGEKIVGGHAIVAVGYDDGITIKNANSQSDGTIGAIRIRNSWGTGWGQGGYGWLPYEYVVRGLAVDWWSLLKNEWVDTGIFKI